MHPVAAQMLALLLDMTATDERGISRPADRREGANILHPIKKHTLTHSDRSVRLTFDFAFPSSQNT
jgi:hypothetical protein